MVIISVGGKRVLIRIHTAEELAAAVGRLFEHPDEAAAMGRRALVCAEARRGATARTLAQIREQYVRAFPCPQPALPQRMVFKPLSLLWKWGGDVRRARALARRRELSTPVISVGNITMGGTGKTPAVLLLAENLQHLRPGILTRGYGRQAPEKYAILEAGERVPPAYSGDEPQMFLRSGLAPVGIGPDRYRAGLMLEQRFRPGVLILDDGFQHLRLARQVDMVLIDALDPFGACGLFPLGRLREPLEQLRRADVLVITRADLGRNVEAIERTLRRHNPHAPVFRAGVRPVAWVDWLTGKTLPPDAFAGVTAAAFCGLGNPESFWATLGALGISPADCHSFEDHHTYRPHELRRMAERARRAGAGLLLTTAKDVLNLPERAEEILAPLRVCWLDIRMEVERADEFLATIEARLHESARTPAPPGTAPSRSRLGNLP